MTIRNDSTMEATLGFRRDIARKVSRSSLASLV